MCNHKQTEVIVMTIKVKVWWALTENKEIKDNEISGACDIENTKLATAYQSPLQKLVHAWDFAGSLMDFRNIASNFHLTQV